MEHIPEDLLGAMLPRATAWSEEQERYILERGVALSESGMKLAGRAGVQNPHLVRLLVVPLIPLPEEPDLKHAAQAFGLITEQTAGMALGHGIFLVQRYLGTADGKLIAHELKHVAQYEAYGFGGFLQKYLSEVNEFGYPSAPMEQEAIDFAESEFPSKA